MNGLHACKPGNEPVVGQVKTFTVEQRTAVGSGKAWTKITSKASDQGGQPYKILSAKPTGHTDSYGNISFNLEIEPANGVQPIPQPSQQAMGPGVPFPPRQHNSDDRSSRIERQHSQEMCLRYFALRPYLLKDMSVKDTAHMIREMTSWFQRDISHAPEAPSKVEQPIEPTLPEDHDEEPF